MITNQLTQNDTAATFSFLFGSARAAGSYFMRSRCYRNAGQAKEADAYFLAYNAIAAQLRRVWPTMTPDFRQDVARILRKAARVERAEQLRIKWAAEALRSIAAR